MPTICIVDDDPIARETLADQLYIEKYDLMFFESGVELLSYNGPLYPDVVLLDVMMPGKDGIELCNDLRKSTDWQHIPIVLITALNTREYMVKGLDAGADDFLSKPVDGLELRARVRSMLRIKQQYDDLQRLMHVREDLANMIVHDMRQPLALIMLRLSVLQQRSLFTQEQAQDYELIYSQVRRLDSFANDLLMAAKMEEGSFVLKRSYVNIESLLRELVESFSLPAEFVDIKLNFNVEPHIDSRWLVDANLIQRLYENLLSNALKYAFADTTVEISLTQPADGMLKITVSDHGPGIPDEYHDTVFDKFAISDLKNKGVTQIGVGLAFCKMAIQAHGGNITVANNEPSGAIFTTTLPR